MHRLVTPSIAFSVLLTLGISAAQAQTEVTAVLAGHAVLPLSSSVAAPKEAGPLLATAGKFTASNRLRTDALGNIPGVTFVGDAKYPRKSGGSLPIKGQSVQGFSGIVSLGKNQFLTLTDNGFGSKINSQDALLMVHHVAADWAKGTVTRQRTIFLRDPDRKVPFFIQNENTAARYLTGADFDPEGAGPNCPNEPRVDCFTRPAKFKRIFKIDFSQLDADGFVKKVAFIDLIKISNPKLVAKRGSNEANFVLPHLGPEGLTVVDTTHIVVVNDNNFLFSSGRIIGQPDDNELTSLNIQALVDAR